jgi:hypothetical protein
VGPRFYTAGGGNAFMAHVGKYVDWRLIKMAPFEEDVELFAAGVDSSLCATEDAEFRLPDGAQGARLKSARGTTAELVRDAAPLPQSPKTAEEVSQVFFIT